MGRIVARSSGGTIDARALISKGAKGDTGEGGGGGEGTVTSVNGVSPVSGNVALTQDSVGDGSTYKQFSATEKTKLAGIATNATANSADSYLLDLANATGTIGAARLPSWVSATVVVPSGGPAPARPDDDGDRVVTWLVYDVADAPALGTSGTAVRYENDIVAVRVV